MKVLFYDPSGTEDLLVKNVIRSRQHDYEVFHDPEAAWESYEESVHPLVIIWYAEDDIATLALCGRIARHRRGPKSFILALVESEEEEQLDGLIDAGIDDYLPVLARPAELDLRVHLAERRLQKVEDTRDFSLQTTAEATLRHNEERFRCLVQNATDLIAIIDVESKILYLSPSYHRALGFDAERKIGTSYLDSVHPDDLGQTRDAFREIATNTGWSFHIEYRFRHREGSWRTIESIGTNLIDKAAVGGIVLNGRDVTERRLAEDRLLHDALHDGLTRLPNRALFMDRLGHALGHRGPRRPDYRCAVLFLDLDRFKVLNDSLGHVTGDRLLVLVSHRLQAVLRPTDTLARLSGDEFVILLDDVKEASNAVRVAKRIQRELQRPFELEGREIYTSVSLGIALSDEETARPEDLLRDADTAMYRAKSRGRASYAIFDAEMHADVLSQLKLETDLRRAIDSWQFEIHYQPIVELQSGAIAGLEALVRWQHPEEGLVPPDRFIPIAEESGLINPLGLRVLEDACHQLRSWQQAGAVDAGCWISVNLSNRQLTQPDLVQQVVDALQVSGLMGTQLVLEITETVVMDNPEQVTETVEALRGLGVRFALDDFGTGHSSLSLLHRFPFDKVKIDRYFVRNVGVDQGSEELVEGVLALCRWRRLETIAEGVETRDQRLRLHEMGCLFAQGYLFAAPQVPLKAEALLRNGVLGHAEVAEG